MTRDQLGEIVSRAVGGQGPLARWDQMRCQDDRHALIREVLALRTALEAVLRAAGEWRRAGMDPHPSDHGVAAARVECAAEVERLLEGLDDG